eukprot:COSAG04_NODE_6587_length_1299_cov_0.754167_1_plen_204_part_10
MRTHARVLLALVASPAAVQAGEATSAAGLSGGAAAVVCVSPQRGFCGTCDACCLDLAAAECDACVADNCGARRCDPGGAGGCNVCEDCCKPYLTDLVACEECVNTTCTTATDAGQRTSHGTVAHPAVCDLDCVEGCFWPPSRLSTTPCFRHCGGPLLLLAVGALVFRLLDYLKGVLWALLGCHDDKVAERQVEQAGQMRVACRK